MNEGIIAYYSIKFDLHYMYNFFPQVFLKLANQWEFTPKPT